MSGFLSDFFQEYEAHWNTGREDEKKSLQEGISAEEKAQWSIEGCFLSLSLKEVFQFFSPGQTLLVQAKRENVGLQLEASYRERLLTAYQQVKNRLDYQVEKTNAERRIAQKNLVEYVIARVKASITPDQEKQNINKCISDLALLAKA